MRILAIADLHDSNFYIKRLGEVEKERDYELLLMCGDIATSQETAHSVINSIKGRAFYIPGNNEPPHIVKIFEDAGMCIHNKSVVYGGWRFTGYGMVEPTPFGTPGEVSSKKMLEDMRRLEIDGRTVLATHCPPKGVLDRGFGCDAVRAVVEEKMPAYCIFGHIHEVADYEMLGNTMCINCPPAMRGGAVKVDLNEKTVEFVEL